MWYLVFPAVLLLAGLLYSERLQSMKGIFSTKPVLSALFIVVALVQPHPLPGFFQYIIAGLVLCMAGDIFLAFRSRSMFQAGLVSFLLGHVFYCIAFFTTARFGPATWIVLVLSCALSYTIYSRLKPHLGTMLVPVVAYIVIITIMVIGAANVLGDSSFALGGRLMVFVGAVSFYISDIFVARNRFVKQEFINRALGLPLYYLGQFLIAFSLGQLASL